MQAGDGFPDVRVVDAEGRAASLSERLGGRPAVVFFYPADHTSGCTREAQDFQRLLPRFREAGVGVFGVSVDDTDSHRRFADDCGLEFPLLTDAGGALSQALGILNEGGRCRRTTYLLAGDGRVRRVWEGVKVDGHADEVLAAATAPPG